MTDLEALKADPGRVDQLDAAELPAVLERASAEHARLALVERRILARLRVPPVVALAGDDDDLLDDEAVGRLLAVPASHVGDLRRRGALPVVHVGKYVRVRRGDVRNFARGASQGSCANGISTS
ncbi:MAG: hypothetical protein KIT14_12615 [bacterium]|nr:hypothetical protein [bacterium]